MPEIKSDDGFMAHSSGALESLSSDTVTATTGRPPGSGTAESTPFGHFTVAAGGERFPSGTAAAATIATAGKGVETALLNVAKVGVQLNRKLQSYATTTNETETHNSDLSEKFR